jgi:hypothetical protein
MFARLLPLGAALAALAVQLWRPTNPDVSWLLTVNDRILAGATPYKDIVELNPPASIWLYRLPALAAGWLGLRAELLVALMVALMIGAVLAYAGRLMARYLPRAAPGHAIFLAVAALVLAVLPFDEMAQREHFATIFMLPCALVAMGRAAGARIRLADALIAGALLGLCVAIKPHFALCALFAASFIAWSGRDLRAFLAVEYWVAAAVALVYLAACAMLYPRFFSDVLPMLADLYLPLRLGVVVLAQRLALLLIVPLALCWLWRGPGAAPGAAVLLLIAAGFAIAFLLQGKGWIYHAYPAIAFSLLAAGWTTQQAIGGATRSMRLAGALGLAVALMLPAPRFFRAEPPDAALAGAIERLAPHPRLLAIAFPLNVGHPLTREVGGVWVGHTWGLWATGGAIYMKAHAGDDSGKRARADAWFDADRLATAADIATQRPDIVLIQQTVGFDFAQWIAGAPELQAAMAHYRRVETVDGIEIYQRADEAAATSETQKARPAFPDNRPNSRGF